jgi:predicted NAD/FAD-dependent oxidoreductase
VAVVPHTGLPFDGALVAGSSAVAWLARDSSKPGRVAPGGSGGGEAWVLHATPDWSNGRATQPREQVRHE